jgi:hypothetical protein
MTAFRSPLAVPFGASRASVLGFRVLPWFRGGIVVTEPETETTTVFAPSYSYWLKTKNRNKPKAPKLPGPMHPGEVVIDEAVLRQMAEEKHARAKKTALERIEAARLAARFIKEQREALRRLEKERRAPEVLKAKREALQRLEAAQREANRVREEKRASAKQAKLEALRRLEEQFIESVRLDTLRRKAEREAALARELEEAKRRQDPATVAAKQEALQRVKELRAYTPADKAPTKPVTLERTTVEAPPEEPARYVNLARPKKDRPKKARPKKRAITLTRGRFDVLDSTPEARTKVVTLFRPAPQTAHVEPSRDTSTLRALGPRHQPAPDIRKARTISIRRSLSRMAQTG